MKKIFAIIMSALLFVLLLIFALNNLAPVTLYYAGGIEWAVPMIILILAVFAAGCLIGMMAMLPFAFKRRRKNKAQAQVQTTEVIPVN